MKTPERRERLKDIQPIEFKEKKPSNKAWLIFALAVVGILIITVIALLTYNHLTRLLPPNQTYNARVLHTTTLTSEESEVVSLPYKNDVLFATQNRLCCFNAKGEAKWQLNLNVLNPILKVNEGYILLAGKNTQDVYLIKDGEILAETTSEYAILNAGVAKNGNFFTVEDEPHYKGKLTVRDKDNKELFVWHSGTAHIIDAAFNDRATHIALTTLTATPKTEDSEQAQTTYTSAVQFFRLYEKSAYKSYEYKDSIAANVYFADGKFITVTDKSIRAYNASDGAAVWNYDLGGQLLQRTCFYNKKLAVLTMKEDGNQTLHILDSEGKLTGNAVTGLKNTGFISLSKEIIAVGSGNRATVFTLDGSERYKITLPKSYNTLCLFGGGQYFSAANNIITDILATR